MRVFLFSLLISLISFLSCVSSEDLYGKYKVYLVTPRNEDELRLLRSIRETFPPEEADFWQSPTSVKEGIHVMTGPSSSLKDIMIEHSLQHEMINGDVHKALIEAANIYNRSSFSHRLHDDIQTLPLGALPIGQYHSYESISNSLQRIAARSRGLAQFVDIGSSVEGRRIVGLKIGLDDGKKNVIVLDAGIHAREWATVHTALYFINMLLSSTGKRYLDELVVYVFPVLNPDGYEYTRIDETDPRYRMWRKNRGREQCNSQSDSTKRCCKGVDLNRNFDFQFGVTGSSRFVCSEIFHGPFAFSEPETRAVRDLFLSLTPRVRAYITLHSYSQLLIHSYSHKQQAYPKDIQDIRSVAARAVAEIEKMYGTKYRFGTGPEIIYGFGGGSTDWATETAHVKYSYTIELRPLYTAWNGFVMKPSELVPTARETWQGVVVVMDKVIQESTHGKIGSFDSCRDKIVGCSGWIAVSPSLCITNALSMKRDCARTCSFCTSS